MSRFHRAAAVAALCLTVLAACGDSGSKSVTAAGESQATTPTTAANPLELVLASSEKVAASKTMRFSLTMGMPQGLLTGEGAMDTSVGVMTMTMDMASLLPPEARQAGSKVEMILKDEAMYMQYPGLAAEAGGKHWIRVNLADFGAAGQLASLATQLREADPTKNVAFLAGAKDVTTVGAETVRGVATTHYKLTIDMQKALAEVPADLRSTVSSAMTQLGLTTLPADVWLDADGLPRRFIYDMALPITGAPQNVHFSMEFFDYGQPVSVTLPPASDVVDASTLD